MSGGEDGVGEVREVDVREVDVRVGGMSCR